MVDTVSRLELAKEEIKLLLQEIIFIYYNDNNLKKAFVCL